MTKVICSFVTCKFNDSDRGVGECTRDTIILASVTLEDEETQLLDCPSYQLRK